MPDRLSLTVQSYDSHRGVVADVEGGAISIEFEASEVIIWGDAAGLRDLARWCLALSDEAAPDGSHVHLTPNVLPLVPASLPLRIGVSNAMTLGPQAQQLFAANITIPLPPKAESLESDPVVPDADQLKKLLDESPELATAVRDVLSDIPRPHE